jgi:hypothetical protein
MGLIGVSMGLLGHFLYVVSGSSARADDRRLVMGLIVVSMGLLGHFFVRGEWEQRTCR